MWFRESSSRTIGDERPRLGALSHSPVARVSPGRLPHVAREVAGAPRAASDLACRPRAEATRASLEAGDPAEIPPPGGRSPAALGHQLVVVLRGLEAALLGFFPCFVHRVEEIP